MKRETRFLCAIILKLSLVLGSGLHAQVPETIHYQGRVTVEETPFDGTGGFKFALVDDGTENVSAATATANVTDGFVTSITVIDGGSGYSEAPSVTISGGGATAVGFGAIAQAVIEDGAVVRINVESAGSGYATGDDAPSVTITPPPPASLRTLWSHDGSSSSGQEPARAISLPVSGGVFSVNLGDVALPGMNTLPVETFEFSPVLLRVWFSDGGDFVLLTPDQPITATPYALHAKIAAEATVAKSVPAGAIGTEEIDGSIGLWTSNSGGFYANGNVGIGTASPQARLQVVGSSIAGLGSNEAIGTNSFASGGTVFDGVDYPNIASGTASFASGGGDNKAIGSASFIGGGFKNTAGDILAFVGGGEHNQATGSHSFVGGGSENIASGSRAFVGGGEGNLAGAANSHAAGRQAKAEHGGTFVWGDNTAEDFASTGVNQFLIRAGGGVGIGLNSPQAPLQVLGNVITGHGDNVASGLYSFVSGGGVVNISGGGLVTTREYPNAAVGAAAFVAGGHLNTASGNNAFIGGGTGNEATGDASSVAGGRGNSATAYLSFIGGGNVNSANGWASFVGGGTDNVASGAASFAAGTQAKAAHDGTFVWADESGGDFSSTGENQFLIRAGGGVGIGADTPQAPLHVLGNVISGHRENLASGVNSFVSGGGAGSASVEMPNAANGDSSFVGGGKGNSASGNLSFVGGGSENMAGDAGTIVGGSNNSASENGFIGGGYDNTASYNGFIAGGWDNIASNNAFIGAGYFNDASGLGASVGGGGNNTASGKHSFVAGGSLNVASGANSFAAGTRAKGGHDGSFVWGDSTDADFLSSAANQFLIRAGGGVGIGRTAPNAALHVKALNSDRAIVLESGNSVAAWGIGTNLSTGHLSFYRASHYASTYAFRASINKDTGAYVSSSDRRLKRDIEPVRNVLDDVLALQPSTYHFRQSEEEGERSYGFIAQEVREIFPEIVSENQETGILGLAYSDFSVLAIQAIKEQQEIIDAQAREIAEIASQLIVLREAAETSAQFEKRLAALENLLSGEPLASR